MGKSSTSTKQGPGKKLDPYFTELTETAKKASQQVDRTPYQNDVVAGPNLIQLLAGAGAAQTAGQIGNTPPALLQNAQDVASGKYLQPGSNPALQARINAAIQPVQQNLFENILPQLRDATLGAGAFGGDRHGIAEGLLLRDFGNTAANISSQLQFDDYTRERQAQLDAPKLYTDSVNAALSGSNILQGVGDRFQGYGQNILDNLYQRDQLNQNRAFAGLDEYARLINAGGYQEGKTTNNKGVGGVLSGIVQGGLGVAGLASGLGAFGGAAKAAGAAVPQVQPGYKVGI